MSDDTAEFRKKFKYVMNQMFPNTNQDFTFNNFDNYINDEKTKEIGLYIVKVKKGCTIELVSDLDKPEGPQTFKKYNKKLKKYVIKELKDFKENETLPKFQAKLSGSGDEILYIGSTPGEKKSEKLNGRLTKYRNFGFDYPKNNLHRGGRRIWFIKDNKNNLVIDYINIETLKQNTQLKKIYEKAIELKNNKNIKQYKKNITGYIEAGLIYLHESAYKVLPFANEQHECEETENEWKEFWKKEYQID